MQSELVTMPSPLDLFSDRTMLIDGRSRQAFVRTAYVRLRLNDAALGRRHVWPVFVFAAAFGIATALLTTPSHGARRDTHGHATQTELVRVTASSH